MGLSVTLIGIQVLGVGAYFGVGFALYQIYVKALKEQSETLKTRLEQKDDEIKRLKEQLKSPSELESTVNILKVRYEQEVKDLNAALVEAQAKGSDTMGTLKQSLEMAQKAVKKIDELQIQIEQLKPYKEKWEDQEQRRKAIVNGLSQIRLSNYSTVKGLIDPKILSDYIALRPTTLEESLGGVGSVDSILSTSSLLQGSACAKCNTSLWKCSKCGKRYCDIHKPEQSLSSTCGNCVRGTLFPST